MPAIRTSKDTSLKLVLNEPELFVEFLRDFVPIEILKDIDPKDVEDVTERLLPLLSEQKDLDTVKRVNLKEGKPLFVITIVDHESSVNFRAPFKMLLYMALILDNYEKEANMLEVKKRKAEGQEYKGKITQTKDFKYPPVLPIVFYDGEDEWTAETNFLDRTEMSGVFWKYIPKFEYELVSLRDYSFEDLVKFGNVLSLFMMIDKLKTAEVFGKMGALREKYGERLNSMDVPPHLKELLVRVATLLLRKINVPQEEIEKFVEAVDERGVSEMLSIEDYDVQETRRLAREEGREEARAEAEREKQEAERKLQEAERKKQEAELIKQEAERKKQEAEQKKQEAEQHAGALAQLLLKQGISPKSIAESLKITEQNVMELVSLSPQVDTHQR